MKKLALAALFAVLGTLAFAADTAPYDSGAVKSLMHSNGSAYGAVNKAITAGDWTAVADGFILMAANAKAALGYAPPKGDPQEWRRIWTDFQFSAYQGVGAAGAKDAAKAKAALDQLGVDRGKGHTAFKS